MKKFIILLFISPFLLLSQVTVETSILTVDDLLDHYPNVVSGYYDSNDEILFDGGDLDTNSEDIEKVHQYKVLMFSGEMYNSDAARLIFWAWPDGETEFVAIDFLTKDKEMVFEFYEGREERMVFEW